MGSKDRIYLGEQIKGYCAKKKEMCNVISILYFYLCHRFGFA